MSNQNRFLCQFRDVGKDYFKTDCAFSDDEQAAQYVDKVVRVLQATTAEGQVFDAQERSIVHQAHRPRQKRGSQ